MTAVRSVESFKYGTRLFAYLFVVLLVGGGLLGLGGVIVENANTSLSNGLSGIPDKTELAGGAVLALFGSAVLLAGLFGIGHKLIADSVATGQSGVDQADPTPESVASTDTDTDSENRHATTTGPSPGEQAARDRGSVTTVPSGARARPPESPDPPAQRGAPAATSQPASSTAAGDQPSEDAEEPAGGSVPAGVSPEPTDADSGKPSDDSTGESQPEPSPEEIAFGTSPNDVDETEDTTVDESVEATEEEGLGPFEQLDEASSAEPTESESDGDPLADPTDDEQ